MDPIIVIESNPTSFSGVCSVSSGQPVTFRVLSGLSSGILVSYEWYLNGILVSISSGYTLNNPSQNDEINLNINNCNSSSSSIIEDIRFNFNDYEFVDPMYIDTASFNYRIISIELYCGPTVTNPSIDNVQININGNPVEWYGTLTSIDVTDIPYIYYAESNNDVSSDDIISLYMNNAAIGSPLFIRGKLKVQRT
jgi:hypothetical protein